MIKSIIKPFLLLASIAVLMSCNKNDAEPSSGEYEYLELGVSSALDVSESMRGLFTPNESGTWDYTFANDNDRNGATVDVKTVVLKGTQEIFNQRLPWILSADKKRLTYNGKLKISKDLLGSETAFTLIASAADGLVAYTVHMRDEGNKYPIHNMSPMAMVTEVKRVGTTLSLSRPAEAKFKQLGVLAEIVVQNNMDVPTVVTGVSIGNAVKDVTISADGRDLEFSTTLHSPNGAFLSQPTDAGKDRFNSVMSNPSRNVADYPHLLVLPKQKNTTRLLMFLPFSAKTGLLPDIYTMGPGMGKAVPSKSPTHGAFIKYTVTLEPGDNSQIPYGMYISNYGVAQPYIERETLNVLYDHTVSQDLSKIEAGMKAYLPNAYIGTGDVLASFVAGNNLFSNGIKYDSSSEYKTTKLPYNETNVNRVSNGTSSGYTYYIVNKTQKIFLRKREAYFSGYWSGAELSYLPYKESDIEQALQPSYWETNKTSIAKVIIPVLGNDGATGNLAIHKVSSFPNLPTYAFNIPGIPGKRAAMEWTRDMHSAFRDGSGFVFFEEQHGYLYFTRRTR